jgi:hypothetical protein
VAIKCRFCNTDLGAFAAAKDAEVEKDLFAGHPAVIYSVSRALPFIAAIVAAAVAAIAGAPAVYVALGFVLLVAIVCASTRYQITTQRIKLERGLLNELHKPLGMRLVGQGALHLFSSDAELETSRTGEDRKE